MSDWQDLGHGHRFTFYGDESNAHAGAILEHPSADWKQASWPADAEHALPYCRANIPFAGRSTRPGWAVAQEEPLTLTPSIACGCGVHGFIQNGKWVSA